MPPKPRRSKRAEARRGTGQALDAASPSSKADPAIALAGRLNDKAAPHLRRRGPLTATNKHGLRSDPRRDQRLRDAPAAAETALQSSDRRSVTLSSA